MKPYKESFEIADKIVRTMVQNGHLTPRPEDATLCQECIAGALRDTFDFEEAPAPKPEPEVEEVIED